MRTSAIAVACSLASALPLYPGAGSAMPPAPVIARPAPRLTADFRELRPRRAVRTIADWVVRSRDNGSAAIFIIDKPRARLYVLDPRGRLRGSAPVLLELALGDDSAPGIGEKPLAEITRDERTTPAGRFVAERGFNAHGEDVVWVDYAAAVSLHRVRPLRVEEHRLERLASPGWANKRISYGCINVPAAFYDTVVQRAWEAGSVVIYVLPDVAALDAVFPRPRSFVSAAALLRRAG
jgi:hypothetical protein